jgi:macrolide-specific efflux system membrane fusion protein
MTSTTESPDAVPSTRGRWRRPGRKGMVIAVFLVIVVAGAGVGVWLGTRQSSTAAALTVTTETVAVTTGTMQQTVASSGTIEPGQEADLDFAVSGQVNAVKVAAGDKVKKGEVLATVGKSALQAELASAQSSLTAAQAKLTSDQAASATASQIDSDDASVTSARAQVTAAQTDLTDASLTSTLNGTVAAVALTVGQDVSGSSSTGSSNTGSSSTGSSSTGSSGAGGATTSRTAAATSAASTSSTSSAAQITVIDTSSYVVSATVDDTEVGQVKVGDQAVITPGSSTTAVYGTVSSVGIIASTSSDVASFPVDIAVTGSPSGLYAGATATVSIITEQLDDVVEVPTAAITYANGKATVTTVDGTRHTATAITTGVSSAGETQVTGGLAAGAKVVERVVKFNGTAGGGARSLFGGTGGATRTGGGAGFGGGGGGFGAGGFGGGGAGG